MAQKTKPHHDNLASEKVPVHISNPGDDSDVVYPPRLKAISIILALCLCLFLVALLRPQRSHTHVQGH